MIDSVAKSYANALIDLLNESKISIDDSLKELQLIEKIVSDDEISRFLKYPNIEKKEKINIINESLSKYNFDKNIISFIEVLVDNNRIESLSSIIEAIFEYVDNLKGVVRVEIISNKDLNEKTLKALVAYLKDMFNKEVVPTVTIDETIIGGFVVKRNGYLLDVSVLNKLKAIKDTVIYGE